MVEQHARIRQRAGTARKIIHHFGQRTAADFVIVALAGTVVGDGRGCPGEEEAIPERIVHQVAHVAESVATDVTSVGVGRPLRPSFIEGHDHRGERITDRPIGHPIPCAQIGMH